MSGLGEFERKTNAALLGKTVASADVGGNSVRIKFTDGTEFYYSASNGGWCWLECGEGREVYHMSGGKQRRRETVADVLAEMRIELNQSWRDIDREKVHDFPDRIEAACKRSAPTSGQQARILKLKADLRNLKRENARLRAALKPVLKCKVMSAMTAEIARGRSDYCAAIIEKAQRVYDESKESEIKE